MQGTVEKAKRARIVPAPTGYVPRAIPAYIRRANHPIAHTTSAARAMKLATPKSIARRPSAMCAIYLAT